MLEKGKLYTSTIGHLFLGVRRSSDGSYTEKGRVIRFQWKRVKYGSNTAIRVVVLSIAFWCALSPKPYTPRGMSDE